jgi:multicomponent Na+:H+ antiporter subunit C
VSGADVFPLAAAALVPLGLYGLLAHPDLLRRIVAANVVGAGVFLLLVAFARRTGEAPDPVPHALVLTGIVVAVSFTGVAVVLAGRLDDLDAGGDDEEAEGP